MDDHATLMHIIRSNVFDFQRSHILHLLNACVDDEEEVTYLLNVPPHISYRRYFVRFKTPMTVYEMYYTGISLHNNTRREYARDLLRKASELGFAPAMYYVDEYHEQGAMMGDPDCLYALWNQQRPWDTDLLRAAAKQGHKRALQDLCRLERRYEYHVKIYACYGQDAYSGSIYTTLQSLVQMGRYRRVYDTGRKFKLSIDLQIVIEPSKFIQSVVNVYVEVTQRARSAALQALVMLRQIIGRDVALIIAKRHIYQNRANDADKWAITKELHNYEF